MVDDEETKLDVVTEFLVEETFSLVKNSVKHLLGKKDNIPEEVISEFVENTSNAIRKLLVSLKK